MAKHRKTVSAERPDTPGEGQGRRSNRSELPGAAEEAPSADTSGLGQEDFEAAFRLALRPTFAPPPIGSLLWEVSGLYLDLLEEYAPDIYEAQRGLHAPAGLPFVELIRRLKRAEEVVSRPYGYPELLRLASRAERRLKVIRRRLEEVKTEARVPGAPSIRGYLRRDPITAVGMRPTLCLTLAIVRVVTEHYEAYLPQAPGPERGLTDHQRIDLEARQLLANPIMRSSIPSPQSFYEALADHIKAVEEEMGDKSAKGFSASSLKSKAQAWYRDWYDPAGLPTTNTGEAVWGVITGEER